jgi:hypothetical protein
VDQAVRTMTCACGREFEGTAKLGPRDPKSPGRRAIIADQACPRCGARDRIKTARGRKAGASDEQSTPTHPGA